MNKLIPILAFVAIAAGACQNSSSEKNANPAARGFDAAHSDPKAIDLADSVMIAMGGRKNYDQLHFISWDFGRPGSTRHLIWDKFDNKVRIDNPDKQLVYLLDIENMEGKVSENGTEVTDETKKETFLNEAKSIWINDSYWLVMPFKLKDSGVQLKYNGMDTTLTGISADVLQLTFSNVGDTPDNKYLVYVDVNDHLVKQWAYYNKASQDSASAVWPWDNYKEYEGVLLSSNRSNELGPFDVKVYNELPEEVFTSFEKTSY